MLYTLVISTPEVDIQAVAKAIEATGVEVLEIFPDSIVSERDEDTEIEEWWIR